MSQQGDERPRRITTAGGLVKRSAVVTAAQDAEIDGIAAAQNETGTAVMRKLIEDGLRVHRLRQERSAGAVEAVGAGA